MSSPDDSRRRETSIATAGPPPWTWCSGPGPDVPAWPPRWMPSWRREQMVGQPACIKHAGGSYVGYALCPCGDRAGHVARLWPREAAKVSRLDPELWEEYDKRTYLMCADCSITANCEDVRPYQDSRPAPEHGKMLSALLRRVRCLETMGYGTSVAFHILSTTIEGGFLRKPASWLNLNAEQIVPLASGFTQEDMDFVLKHMESSYPDEATFERMEYLDRVIEMFQARDAEESRTAEVVPLVVEFEASAESPPSAAGDDHAAPVGANCLVGHRVGDGRQRGERADRDGDHYGYAVLPCVGPSGLCDCCATQKLAVRLDRPSLIVIPVAPLSLCVDCHLAFHASGPLPGLGTSDLCLPAR